VKLWIGCGERKISGWSWYLGTAGGVFELGCSVAVEGCTEIRKISLFSRKASCMWIEVQRWSSADFAEESLESFGRGTCEGLWKRDFWSWLCDFKDEA